MYMLTVVNRTAAIAAGNDGFIRFTFYAEILVYVYSYVQISTLAYMLHTIPQYHKNFSTILLLLCYQYYFSKLARMLQIVMQLLESSPEVLCTYRVFIASVWTRHCCLFIAFHCAPFVVVERVFATIYMRDYETNQRLYIGHWLNFVCLAVSLLLAQLFIFDVIPRIVSLIVCGVLNLLGFLMCYATVKYNTRQYRKIRQSMAANQYSLSERVQISENISASRPFEKLCLMLTVFASVCCSLLYVDEYTSDDNAKNIGYVIFNWSCIVYGTFVPFYMICYSKLYRRAVAKYYSNRVSRWLASRVSDVGDDVEASPKRRVAKVVRDTFGRNMIVADGSREAEVYFSQLQADWNAPNKCQKVGRVVNRVANGSAR